MTATETPSSAIPTSGRSTSSTSPKSGPTTSRGKRENAAEKGRRLLTEGRLNVVRRDGDLIVAECRGDSGEVYHLGHEPGSARPWRCTCPAKTACSHLNALWLVTAVKR